MTTSPHKPGSIEWLKSRLPRADLVTIPELALAACVSSETVEGWIDSGEIEAIDLGARRQHAWKLSKPSIIEFWERRRLGLRLPQQERARPQAAPPKAHIPITGDLFEHAASGARRDSK